MNVRKRQEIANITEAITKLIGAGYKLVSVDDGEEEYVTETVPEAVEAVDSVDSATVYFHTPDGQVGYIWFVLGNDPEEVAADWTVNLDPTMKTVSRSWWS